MVLGDGRESKEKAVTGMVLVISYSVSDPVWRGTLVGNVYLCGDIRCVGFGDNRLLRELKI
jgi:hypothetical protein